MHKNISKESLHFLIVDDFGAMRRIVAGLLKQLGHSRITEADDGVSALQILETPGNTINFVLTDWNMPGMDGLALLKAIRSNLHLRRLPVLMVTAEGKRENILEAASAGADSYIIKPFNAVTLQDKLEKIIKRRSEMKDSDKWTQSLNGTGQGETGSPHR